MKLLSGSAVLAVAACSVLGTSGPASADGSRHYWSPCVSQNDVYGPTIRYGLGIPWLYVPPEPMTECGPPAWLGKPSRHMRRLGVREG